MQAPTIGSILFSIAAALVGVIGFVRRQSLLGEVLSHAAYPGIVLSVLFLAFCFPKAEEALGLVLLVGALAFSLIGALLLRFVEKKLKVNSDAALCLILSSFLGIGVLLSSRLQLVHPKWLNEISVFLCGQAATMTDLHIYLYGALLFVVILFMTLFFRKIRLISFDPDFAKLSGLSSRWMDVAVTLLFAVAVMMGVKGVGVVLMAGMLIAPAIAARALTHRLSLMLVIAGICGGVSGFFGVVVSVYGSHFFRLPLPTGPVILTIAALISLTAVLFAPRQGLFLRYARILYFRFRCLRENILKFLWKRGCASFKEIQEAHHISFLSLWLILQTLKIEKSIENGYCLLGKGLEKAESIVRLHRLWELYLHSHLGIAGEKVHFNAEEMEHVITPEIERELTELLNNPERDPHNQPIPKKGCDR